MSEKISGVILAAGLSRRMLVPKMLLPWGPTTVLGQVVSTFDRAGVSEIIIITGGFREMMDVEVKRLASSYNVKTVHNPLFDSGEMLSSLQTGLAALGVEVAAALVGLGDQPQLSLDAILKVITAYKEAPAPLVVPSCNMRRGHPWLLQRRLWGQLLELKAPATMRNILNDHASEIVYVQTDSTILKDLDTPEDYQREKP